MSNFSKNKNIRDLYRGKNEFKRGYQSRSNLVKNEHGDACRFPQHYRVSAMLGT
jgi:hypothetical protein